MYIYNVFYSIQGVYVCIYTMCSIVYKVYMYVYIQCVL